MGQQQLLLLVLATVIVGIATVVGITAFDQNSAKSNADAMMNDAVRIASDIQAWAKKPQPFGGPVDYGDMTNADFSKIGYGGTAATYKNTNGTYTLTAGATPQIDGENTVEGNKVTVMVCSTDEDGVKGAVIDLNGTTGVGTAPSC